MIGGTNVGLAQWHPSLYKSLNPETTLFMWILALYDPREASRYIYNGIALRCLMGGTKTPRLSNHRQR